MKIYPKTNEYLEGIEYIEEKIKKDKGIEIQYFNKEKDNLIDFEMEEPIKKILEKYPYIEEITVHPPLTNYELEIILLKDKNIFLNQIKQIVEISKRNNIKINIIEHTRLLYSQIKRTIIPILEEASRIMENTNTKILFENIYMMEEQENCTVIELCEFLNNEHIKVCIDICHLYCQAHIYKIDIEEFFKKYIDKQKAKRQVYQVHFANTGNHDGYIDRKTHGIVHENEKELYYDADLICSYNMEDCNWVTEVTEENYKTREMQIIEINTLEKYKKIRKGE